MKRSVLKSREDEIPVRLFIKENLCDLRAVRSDEKAARDYSTLSGSTGWTGKMISMLFDW
jgi:hypothetical protein